MNPLNLINKYFMIELWNPTPKMAALKSGDRFTLSFEVDKETFDLFCGAPSDSRQGMILEGALKVTHNHQAVGVCDDDGELIQEGSTAPAKPAKAKGDVAQRLYKSGYFNNPKLWAALEQSGVYTGKGHYGFIRSKPCLCCSTTRNTTFHSLIAFQNPIPCSGDVTWHHIRTSANAGTGIKPHDLITVPICDAHHRAAHDYQTKELNSWLLEQAAAYRADGIKQAMKLYIGMDSLSELTEQALAQFHRNIGYEG